MLQSPIPTQSLACVLMLIILAALSDPMTSHRVMSPKARETLAQTQLTSDLSIPPLGTPGGRPRGGGSRNCDSSRLNFA